MFQIIILLLLATTAWAGMSENESVKYPARSIAVANPNVQNRVHRRSNMWMNITNWGFFGNYFIYSVINNPMTDPEYPGTYAPQCEFPAGSETMYLFQGAIWVGALVQAEGYEFPRVSTGTEGWFQPRITEFYPGEGEGNGIIERSTIPNQYNFLGDYISDANAVSEQDFIVSYADTLTDRVWVGDDPVDGLHYPLGIKITQKSYSWTYNYAQDFIIFDYEIENIADRYLKNLYIGVYVDSDVGRIDEQPHWKDDDICGFRRYHYYQRPDGSADSVLIDIAYIADNDGRPYEVTSGNDFYSPGVAGTRVIRAPNPRLKTAFNWWISNTNPDLDFGPSWTNDNSGGWTTTYGTPVGDAHKYFILSNLEFDYDQIYVDNPDYLTANPQNLYYRNPATGEWIDESHNWKLEDLQIAPDLADGFDTRYLISWGPLGIYDHTDEAGNDIFRLNPGEKFNMTIAYIGGENFHDKNNPQTSNTDIDPFKFNFADLSYNAAWAKWVYDNPMKDTPVYDYGNDHNPVVVDWDGSQGDGVLETGDGWYGEDTGSDGLYAVLPPGTASVEVYYFGIHKGTYTGPDADGSEMNGELDVGEDNWSGPEYMETTKYGTMDLGYMRNNDILDEGDGIPDFQGPPPPPTPTLVCETKTNSVILRWGKNPSEDPIYQDPFSRKQDFEGYRIYVSNTGLVNDYAILAQFDKVDFAYFSAEDSMVTFPDNRTNAPAETTIAEVQYYRRAVGLNTGMSAIAVNDSQYADTIANAHPLFPRWYAVTAYDCGDPQTGTAPLETAYSANAQYIAPSGSPSAKVMVVPNPYRAYEDYTTTYLGGLSWENQDDGSPEFYPATDRRLEFFNLPPQCLIRIYTVAGDLVAVVPHNIEGDNSGWASEYSESWDLNSRNQQQVVSGLYLFSVENYSSFHKGEVEVGKFVIIR